MSKRKGISKTVRRREVFITRAFFLDQRWVSVSAEARLLALGLWTIADQRGSFACDPTSLDTLLAFGGGVGPALDELADAGLVMRNGDTGIVESVDATLRRSGRFVGARPLGSSWQATRLAILSRDGECCRYCSTTIGPFQIDHIFPVSRGGCSDHDNLCVACQPCNRAKGDKLLSEWVR